MPHDPRLVDLLVRYEELCEQGQAVTPEELCRDCPELLGGVQRHLRGLRSLNSIMKATPPGDEPHVDRNGQVALPRNIPGYEILEMLGRGGMGVVCKARHVKLNRLVALKLLRAGDYATTAESARFRTEAEAVARLQHPHVVQIYESGEHEGRAYLALEYVDGSSLAAKTKGTPQPAREAARLVETLARAMHAAHQHGVIHRDLKPSNVLLTADGVPKLTDFGLAKKLDDVGQTQSGAVMGTPPYMAPEQAAGKNREVGPATDVYALGAILYELLTGRPPFKAENTMETLRQVLADEPLMPRQVQAKVPRDLETICLKCLRKEPEKRYASAEELAEDLRRFLAGEPIRGRRANVVERGIKWARRRPALTALVATVLMALVGAIGGTVWHTRQLGDALRQSELREHEAHVLLYASDMKVAHQFWQTGDVRRVRAFLERHRPRQGAPDLRGFEWDYLRRLGHTDARWTLSGHEGEVYGVAFAPDGRSVATAGQDGVVRLWEFETQRVRAELRGHVGPIRSVAYAADGRFLVTAGDDRTAKLWDAATGQMLTTFPGHKAGIHSAALSPDGKRLASAGHDGTLRLHDVATGKETASFPMGEPPLHGAAFSPNGKQLAVTAGPRGFVWLLDTSTGRRQEFLGDLSPHLSAAFDSYGRRLAVTRVEGLLQIQFISPDSKAVKLAERRLSPGAIRSVAFSPCDRFVVAGGDDAVLRLWDLATHEQSQTFAGHTDRIWCVAFSPDGRQVATASADGTVKIWDLPSRQDYEPLRPAARLTNPSAWSSDCKLVAVAGEGGRVRLLDAKTWQIRAVLPGHRGVVLGLSFSPDGTTLATGGSDRFVRLWDVATGQQRQELWEGDRVSCVAFAPRDGKTLATGGAQRLRLHDLVGKKVQDVPHHHSTEIVAMTFSPDGKLLVTAGQAHFARVWDVDTGEEAAQWGAGAHVKCVAFAPDGKTAAVSRHDGKVELRDLARPGQVDFLSMMSDALAFLPDGRGLAVGQGDTVELIDLANRHVFRILTGHRGAVLSMRFSRDGKSLTATTADGAVQYWHLGDTVRVEAPTGQPLSRVRALAFASDGMTLITGSSAERSGTRSIKRILGKDVISPVQVYENRREAIRLWDVASATQKEVLPLHPWVELRDFALSANGRVLAVACLGGTLGLWDLSTRREQFPLFVNPKAHADWSLPALGNRAQQLLKFSFAVTPNFTTAIRALALSPDGSILAAADDQSAVRLWETAGGKELRALSANHTEVNSLAFAPGGGVLAVNDGGRVRLWDVASGEPRWAFEGGHKDTILRLVFSPDGTLLATAAADRQIKVWDLATGRERFGRVAHLEAITALAFSPHDGGRTLVSAGGDGSVKLWHVETGQELLTLEGHTGKVHAVAFAPDGRTLATGGETPQRAGEVFLWRTDASGNAPGRQRVTLRDP